MLKAVQFNDEHHAMLTFPFFDADSDGAVTAQELGETVRKFINKNPSNFYLQQKIDLYDSNGINLFYFIFTHFFLCEAVCLI